ncbi:MAG: MauE/DoxX family redox-associated membrane protein [Thermodesulfobacteriota bacterium]|nr:MauE/DoxX family redox-associated membrane protein [Thermodesulfobacteriota bacterium]
MAVFPWSWLVLVSRLVLGGLFIYAGLEKIIYSKEFAELVFNYKLLPTEAVNIVALVLPWLEIIAGFLLIMGLFTLPASAILVFLVLVFVGAVGFNLARGLDFQCGCFSASTEARNAALVTLLRDIALLVPAAICLIGALGQESRLMGSDRPE